MSSTPSGSDDAVPTTPAPREPEPPAAAPAVSREPAPPTAAGAHAAPRPYPPSAPTAPPAPAPAAETGWTTPSGFEGAAARERAQTAEPVDLPAGPAPTAPLPARTRRRLPRGTAAPVAGPAVEPPRRPGFGRHALATVVGLLVTPFALLLVGIGASGLGELADDQSVAADWLSFALLLAGVAVLAAIVLLGSWSPALPVTGGLVWGVGLGAAYLAAPWVLSDAAAELTSDGSVPKPIQQLADAATSGYLLALGVLLVCAGVAAGVARRTGRRFAEAVVAAERAAAERASAERPDPVLSDIDRT